MVSEDQIDGATSRANPTQEPARPAPFASQVASVARRTDASTHKQNYFTGSIPQSTNSRLVSILKCDSTK
jgi:hypothetical protein